MKRIRIYAFLSAICMILSACGQPLEPTPGGSQQRALPPKQQNVKEEVIPQTPASTVEWVTPPSLDYDDIQWAGSYTREFTMMPDLALLVTDTSLSADMRSGANTAYRSFFVSKNNKCGFVDINGEEVVNVQYELHGCIHCAIMDIIYNFPNGKDDIFCGGHSIPPDFLFYDVESKRFYDVDEVGGLHARDYINHNNDRFKFVQGNTIWSEDMNDYTISQETWENRRYGFVDNSENIIVPTIYKEADRYFEGYAAVQAENEKWGFIDKQGIILVDCKYDYVGHFNEGYAVISNGDKWGYIDITGKEVIPPQFEGATEVVDGKCYIKENGLWGIAKMK